MEHVIIRTARATPTDQAATGRPHRVGHRVNGSRSAHRVAARARLNRDSAIVSLQLLTDERLDDLARRGMFTTRPDGYPAATMADGMPHGAATLTSVEAAAYRRVGAPDGNDNLSAESDPLGDIIRDLLDLPRRINKLTREIHHDLETIRWTPDRAQVRKSEPGGDCLCCTENVTGAEWDRLKRGLCNRCYCQFKFWRAGQSDPSLERFVAHMRPAINASTPSEHSASRLGSWTTGGFIAGVGEMPTPPEGQVGGSV